jgi:drug/metabolite transporter (DMT)-like permease
MGEIAALLVSVCWALCGIFFNAAGKKIGAFSVNRIRLSFAVILFFITHLLVFHTLIPNNISSSQWLWLSLSGIVGLIIGDTFLYQAFIYLDLRIPFLVMSTVPMISTFLAWLFLNEQLKQIALVGVIVTVLGILLVINESNKDQNNNKSITTKKYILGILFSLVGAFGQAGGLIFAKFGMQNDTPVLSATLVRMLAAMIAIWILAIFQKDATKTFVIAKQNPKSVLDVFYGSIIGPFIGVWLSLLAVKSAYIGTTSTLMALTPIVLLPISKWFYKENISKTSVIGTVVTILGVAIIFIG